MKLLGNYKNGNYIVSIYDDGTKIRESEGNGEFLPSFAENCDVKITDYCDGGCKFCYEGCSTDGKFADILNQKWIQTLHPYTEMALNGNDLSHPQLLTFLQYLKSKNIIANITVNQIHFERKYDFIKQLVDNNLVYGVGISLQKPTEEFMKLVQTIPNAVIHTINGVLTLHDAMELVRYDNVKILILGYKEKNRGIEYKREHEKEISDNMKLLKTILPYLQYRAELISYDNLALEQIDVKNVMKISDSDWAELYMGDDGKFTFYIDAVNKTFSKNSVVEEKHDLLDNIDDMFTIIRKE